MFCFAMHIAQLIHINLTCSDLSQLDCSIDLNWTQLWWLKSFLPIFIIGTRIMLHYCRLGVSAVRKFFSKREDTTNGFSCSLPPSIVSSSLRLLRILYLPILKNNLQVLVCDSYSLTVATATAGTINESYLRHAPHLDCTASSRYVMVRPCPLLFFRICILR